MRPFRALLGVTAFAATGVFCLSPAAATFNILWLVQNELQRNSEPQKQVRELNTLKDIFAAIRRCYRPPSQDQAFPGMRITVQFAYTRAGELFGKPHIRFETPGILPAHQSAYRLAVAATLVRCSRLPFSESLGNAVAGRIFTIQFVDQRTLRQAEYPSWLNLKTP